MARLPIPGADEGTWGDILNDYLAAAHKADGTLKDNSITAAQLAPSAVDGAAVATSSITAVKLNVSGGNNGDVLVKDTTTAGGLRWGLGGSSDPTLGGDLTGTASNAQLLAGVVGTTEIADDAVTGAKIAPDTVLEGNLAPAVQAKLNTGVADGTLTPVKLSSDTPVAGELLSYNGTGFEWITAPAAGGGGEANTAANIGTTGVGIYKQKTGVNFELKKVNAASGRVTIVDNTGNNTVDVDVAEANLNLANMGGSLAQSSVTGLSASLSAKADDSAVVHSAGNETVAGVKTFSSSPIVPTPSTSTQAANKSYVDTVAASGAPDATTGSKGIVQLAGDLGGTAAAPTVPGLAGKASTATTISAGTGLTGGGSLAANRTLAVSYGTTAGTAAQGNDSRIVGAEQAANKGVANGYASLNASTRVPTAQLGTGTASSSTYLRGDGTWATPAGGGGGGYTFTFASVTSNYTAVNNNALLVDSTSGGITITLPSPVANGLVRVKRLNPAGNGIQVAAPAGSYIDGSTVGTDTLNNQYDSRDYWSDGNNWYR